MLALLRAAYSGGQDAHLVASMEQALPLQSDWLNFNRFCLRAERGMQIYKGLRAHLSAKGALHSPYMNKLQLLFPTSLPGGSAFS